MHGTDQALRRRQAHRLRDRKGATADPGVQLAGAEASVGGVTGTGANDAGCLAGYFCLYTQSFGNGVKFSLRQCRVYALSHWNGVGSFTNNNTHGAPAQLLDRNYNVIYTSYPFEYVPRFDFAPVWYVRACLW